MQHLALGLAAVVDEDLWRRRSRSTAPARSEAATGEERETELATWLARRAAVLFDVERFDEAGDWLVRAVETRARAAASVDPELLAGFDELGRALVARQRGSEAVALYERALAAADLAVPPASLLALGLQSDLGRALLELDRSGDAERHLTVALQGLHETVGEEHPETLAALESLAELYEREGRFAAAESMARVLVAWSDDELASHRARLRLDRLRALQ